MKQSFGLLIAAVVALSNTAPIIQRIQPRQNVTTSSERLGLKWQGGNSSLPKIL
jgi:L-asparaginase